MKERRLYYKEKSLAAKNFGSLRNGRTELYVEWRVSTKGLVDPSPNRQYLSELDVRSWTLSDCHDDGPRTGCARRDAERNWERRHNLKWRWDLNKDFTLSEFIWVLWSTNWEKRWRRWWHTGQTPSPQSNLCRSKKARTVFAHPELYAEQFSSLGQKLACSKRSSLQWMTAASWKGVRTTNGHWKCSDCRKRQVGDLNKAECFPKLTFREFVTRKLTGGVEIL